MLGLNTSVKLNLVKKVYQLIKCIMLPRISNLRLKWDEFSDSFGEIGCLPRVHDILKPKLKLKLQPMVDLDIIETVEKPTDWV